jgi:predicted transcriptional regulator
MISHAIVHGTMMNANPERVDDLRARRNAVGLTQQRLAELARCSLAHLQLLERGYEPSRSRVRERIFAVLAEQESPW